jgi:hypothetical protein
MLTRYQFFFKIQVFLHFLKKISTLIVFLFVGKLEWFTKLFLIMSNTGIKTKLVTVATSSVTESLRANATEVLLAQKMINLL